MRRAGIIGLVLAAIAPVASAEVRVVLNGRSEFAGFEIETDDARRVYWGKTSDRPASWCVNLEGDIMGDRRTASAVIWVPEDPPLKTFFYRPEPETEPDLRQTAVVVWPRSDGNDWELVYSIWNDTIDRWIATKFVERVDNTEDDLNPVLEALASGVRLTWRRNGRPMVSTGTVISGSDGIDVLWTVPQLETVPFRVQRSTAPALAAPGP